MANTYKIREVTVTIPKIGIVSRDAEGNEFKCGEIYHINLFAVRPGWQTRTSDFDGLIVGRLDFSGYTESPYSRTQKIIMPNGYELVALRVSESGRPMTWESLPVISSGADFSDSKAFTVENGEVFISNAFIGNSIAASDYRVMMITHDTGKHYAAGMVVGIDVQKGKVEFKADDFKITPGMHFSLSELFMPPQPEIDAKTAELKKAVDEWITETIKLHCRPGGIIWQATRRNR